jgi:error-prone DNA polymerase
MDRIYKSVSDKAACVFARDRSIFVRNRPQGDPSITRTGAPTLIRLEPRFAELAAMTNFSFLRGASHPEEMAARAAELGLAGIGIADRNSLAGVVRAHTFAPR